MSDPIIEAAIDTAMEWTPSPYDIDIKSREAYGVLVDEILKIVAPLTRAAALEEAAQAARSFTAKDDLYPELSDLRGDEIADAILALKEQPVRQVIGSTNQNMTTRMTTSSGEQS